MDGETGERVYSCRDPMMAPSRLTPMLAAGLLVALVAGCGGDTRRAESETTAVATHPAPAPAPSHQGATGGPVIATKVTDPARRAYVARVDAVCGRLDPERSRAQGRVGESARPREAVKAYDDTIALGQRELRQIEAIPVPPGEQALLRANVFDVIRRELVVRRRIGSALAAVDVPRLRRLRGELDNLSRSLGGFARGYGFRVCGED
jgi:hypothetical protein